MNYVQLPNIEKAIWERFSGRCANCGSTAHLDIKFIIPIEAGGKMTETNGALVCRNCELLTDHPIFVPEAEKKLANFWISRKLYDETFGRVKELGFNGTGSFLRFLITKFVDKPDRYEDVLTGQCQDEGTEVKINFWIDHALYRSFKAILEKRGVTITDTLKGLVMMYSINRGSNENE